MKIKLVVLLFAATVVIGGCASRKDENKGEKPPVQQEEQNKQEENQKEEELKDENSDDEKNNGELKEETEECPDKFFVNIYVVSPEDGTLKTETKECEELNGSVLWDFLKEMGIVPKKSKVVALKEEGNKLILDVDSVFGQHLRNQGTAGENEILGCVVNTFLDAYDCEEIKITEEGKVLLSGHAEYSEYFTKF